MREKEREGRGELQERTNNVCVFVCMYVCAFVDVCIRACKHACMHTHALFCFIYVRVCVFMSVSSICLSVLSFVHA